MSETTTTISASGTTLQEAFDIAHRQVASSGRRSLSMCGRRMGRKNWTLTVSVS